MTIPCIDCGRTLRRPSSDGRGPICRRQHQTPAGPDEHPRPGIPLDHAALAAAGQLAIPILPTFSDCAPAWHPDRRRRRITTISGPDTWEDQ
ncbi:hypothetical protein [Streptomyces noursei]|uniref:hypothetical protein n=1 Tax=Streptomyces noursei TaxID=1971 RepID=UPI0023B840EF|nr:hypothetical protein [Streptomyces noursei]